MYLLHIVLEPLDRGNSWVRWFSVDLGKGFDLIDLRVMIENICSRYTPLLSALDCVILGRQDANCQVALLVMVSIEI